MQHFGALKAINLPKKEKGNNKGKKNLDNATNLTTKPDLEPWCSYRHHEFESS